MNKKAFTLTTFVVSVPFLSINTVLLIMQTQQEWTSKSAAKA